jgi:hypothetical protein
VHGADVAWFSCRIAEHFTEFGYAFRKRIVGDESTAPHVVDYRLTLDDFSGSSRQENQHVHDLGFDMVNLGISPQFTEQWQDLPLSHRESFLALPVVQCRTQLLYCGAYQLQANG